MVGSVGSCRNRCWWGKGCKALISQLEAPRDTSVALPKPRRETEGLPTAHPARPPPSPEGAAFPACFLGQDP